jgi:hypothetical protein
MDEMNQPPAPSTPRKRRLRGFLPIAGGFVGIGILGILAVGWFEFSLRSIPEPEIAGRIAAERMRTGATDLPTPRLEHNEAGPTSPTAFHANAERRPRRPIGTDPRLPADWDGAVDFILPRDQWGGWMLVRPEEYPVDPDLTLFPVSSDLPSETQQSLLEINRVFRECRAVIEVCRDPHSGLTFRETDDLLHEVLRNQQAHLKEFSELFNVEQNRSFKESNARGNVSEGIESDAGYRRVEAIRDQWNSVVPQLWDAFVENAVRDEQWLTAARMSREWDDQVYYFRKQGGIEGYGALTLRAIEKSYDAVSDLPVLSAILP